MNSSFLSSRCFSYIATIVTACMIVGCEPTAPREISSDESVDKQAAVSNSGRDLRVVDRVGYDAAIAEHRGKVVLIDFWATWCLPCVEQFPHTLELAERFGKRGLAVITVSFDEPLELQHVTGFLNSHRTSGVTNLISRFGTSPRSMEAFEIPSGAVPYYKVYDRSGMLRHSFGIDPGAKEQFSLDDIDAAVEMLLAE